MKLNKYLTKSPLLMFGLFLSAFCFGQQSTVKINSLEEAVSLGMESNLILAVNDLHFEKAKMEVKLAKSNRLPQISGTFSGQKNLELATTFVPGELFGQPGETVAAQFGQEYQYNAGININKSFFDPSNRIQMKTKKQDVAIQITDNTLYKQSLVSQISYSYYAFLIADEALQLAKIDLVVADSILQISEAKFKEGFLDLGALNRSKINRNRVLQSVDEALLIYDDSHHNLKIALGLDDKTDLKLNPTMSLNILDIQEGNTLSENLDLLLYEQYKEKASLNLKQQRAEFLPKFSMNSYLGSQLFQDDFDFSVNNADWSPLRYVGLNVSLPIFNGFSIRRKVKIAKIEAEVAELNLKQAQQSLEQEDVLLLKNRDLTASIALSNLKNFQLHKEISDLEFSKYNEGIIGLENYLNAFEDYLNAKNAFLNSLTRYYQYHAKVYSRS